MTVAGFTPARPYDGPCRRIGAPECPNRAEVQLQILEPNAVLWTQCVCTDHAAQLVSTLPRTVRARGPLLVRLDYLPGRAG